MRRRLATAVVAVVSVTPAVMGAAPAATAAPTGYQPGVIEWQRDGSGASYGPHTRRTPAAVKGIISWQRLLNVPRTARWDSQTSEAVVRLQRSKGDVPVTGNVDYRTARHLLWPVIYREAKAAGIDPLLLCGHLYLEARLDPGAVGRDGGDLGIAQIVPRYGAGTDPWNVTAAVRYMAQRDAQAIRRYGVLIGPVAYWKPQEAAAWKRTGKPSKAADFYRYQVHKGCWA